MKLSMTIAERIAQAERIQKQGSYEEMVQYASLKDVLVGFADAQKTAYRIVEVGGRLCSGVPETITSVTLEDDLVKAFAKCIRRKSQLGQVQQDEAKLFKLILEEDARLEEETAQNSQEVIE